MADYLVAIGGIFFLLLCWTAVQHLVREFARRHPEFGPAPEEGGGCGSGCSCNSKGRCNRRPGTPPI